LAKHASVVLYNTLAFCPGWLTSGLYYKNILMIVSDDHK
jgi:hypothetical protein